MKYNNIYKIYEDIKETDPEVYNLIMNEWDRQNNCLEMIASENEPSLAVLEAQASRTYFKICRGIPRKKILWRLPHNRPNRTTCYW